MSKNIELNANKKYILCGDISASMQTVDPKCGGQSRYPYMLEKFKQFITESADFDADGPTILLFGESIQVFENTSLDKVDYKLSKVSFEGFTNTHLVIEKAWELHNQNKSLGTVVFVFTDGAPTNQAALERTITRIANTVSSPEEFSIGFVLVGTIEPSLKSYLDKLDDGLKVAHDIVGTTEIEGLTFLKAVNNAINE